MNKKVTAALIAGLAGIIAFCGKNIADYLKENQHNNAIKDHVNDIIAQDDDNSSDDKSVFSRKAWNDLYAENSDLAGYLYFKDGSISTVVMKAGDNNKYLRKGYDLSYSVIGTPFFDCGDNLEDDSNLIIYGHSYIGSPTRDMFTPLADYVRPAALDQCDTFYIWYQNEKVTYQITDVYHLSDPGTIKNFDYKKSNFADVNDFNHWYEEMKQYEYYDSGESLIYGDRTVTLQTCLDAGGTERIYVVGKEIKREKY